MNATRRDFLASVAASGVALTAPAVHSSSKDKTYRTALIGSGWWGRNIVRTAAESGCCAIVALCDVDRNQLDPAVAELERLTGRTPAKYHDYRELLAKEKPDIAIVATPDHWHPLAMIEAVKAGAHVYVEKPICHTINEGRAMVAAARAAGRVVQVGTHRRASPHNISAHKFMKEGRLGKIGMVRAFVHYGGGPGKITPDSDPPEGLDWDFWCGPAPLRPYNKAIHPKGFRRFLDYANGQLGDWGIHWLDQVLWWSEEQWPRKVFSTGARRVLNDSTDVPDTQIVAYEFESFTAEWEHRLYAANGAEKANVGCYFYGTEGTLHVGWLDGWTFYPAAKSGKILHEDPHLNMPDQQNIRELWSDFLASIASGARPISDIEHGHRSTSMSLLGMLSMKLGRSIVWDGHKEQVVDDPAANQLLSRPYRSPWKYPEVG